MDTIFDRMKGTECALQLCAAKQQQQNHIALAVPTGCLVYVFQVVKFDYMLTQSVLTCLVSFDIKRVCCMMRCFYFFQKVFLYPSKCHRRFYSNQAIFDKI